MKKAIGDFYRQFDNFRTKKPFIIHIYRIVQCFPYTELHSWLYFWWPNIPHLEKIGHDFFIITVIYRWNVTNGGQENEFHEGKQSSRIKYRSNKVKKSNTLYQFFLEKSPGLKSWKIYLEVRTLCMAFSTYCYNNYIWSIS